MGSKCTFTLHLKWFIIWPWISLQKSIQNCDFGKKQKTIIDSLKNLSVKSLSAFNFKFCAFFEFVFFSFGTKKVRYLFECGAKYFTFILRQCFAGEFAAFAVKENEGKLY